MALVLTVKPREFITITTLSGETIKLELPPNEKEHRMVFTCDKSIKIIRTRKDGVELKWRTKDEG